LSGMLNRHSLQIPFFFYKIMSVRGPHPPRLRRVLRRRVFLMNLATGLRLRSVFDFTGIIIRMRYKYRIN